MSNLNNDLEAVKNDFKYWKESSGQWAEFLINDLEEYRKNPSKETAEEVDSTFENLKMATSMAMQYMKKMEELAA